MIRKLYRRVPLLLMFASTDEEKCVMLRICIYLENRWSTTHRWALRCINVPRTFDNGHNYFPRRSVESNLKVPADLGIAVPPGCALHLDKRTVVVPLLGEAEIISIIQLCYCSLNCTIESLPKRFCITEKFISCNLSVEFAWFIHLVHYSIPFRHQARARQTPLISQLRRLV